jgi:DNA polymerase III alpha subunit
VKCLTWSEAFEKYSGYLKDDELLIVEGRVESADGQEITLIVNEVRSLGDAIPSKARQMSVTLPPGKTNNAFLDQLCAVFNTNHGRCEVYLNMVVDEVAVKMEYQPNRIQGSRKLERDLTEMGCAVEWVL